MQMGYIGPKSRPTREIAMASPIRDGTNQMTNSKLTCNDKSLGQRF